MIDTARARAILDRFSGLRVAVLGDLILDRYVWGNVERISPEAPVPVVRVERESTMLGGAGNVARNLVSLGARAGIAAVVGEDEQARELGRLCAAWKIDASAVVAEPGRPTTLKTRVIARGQQLVRYDRESEQAVGPDSAEALLDTLRALAPRLDGVIVQDYSKGLLTAGLVREAMAVFAERGLPVFVDPKAGDWSAYRGAWLIKPNLREAEQLSGIHVRGEADLERLGREILACAGAGVVAVTRGEEGMTLFQGSGGIHHVPTAPRAVADVAGAGDTAIATLALARLGEASWIEAAQLANAAAGFVVGLPGTATLGPEDLLASLGAGR